MLRAHILIFARIKFRGIRRRQLQVQRILELAPLLVVIKLLLLYRHLLGAQKRSG